MEWRRDEALAVFKRFVLFREREGHITLGQADMVQPSLVECARQMASHPCLPYEGCVWISNPDRDCILLDLVLNSFPKLILGLDYLG